MEHVAYFMNENVKACLREQKTMQIFFDTLYINDLRDVHRRNAYYEHWHRQDIKYVKTKFKELQILLAVCKNLEC